MWVSISAFVLGFSMLIFLVNAVYSLIFVRQRAEANPWRSKSIEWQVPTPVPVNNFEQIPVFDSDPYDYGTPLAASAAPAGGGGGLSDGRLQRRRCRSAWRSRPVPPGVEIPPEPPEVGARALYVAARLLAGATTFFFLAFVFAYFYLRSLNQDHMWRRRTSNPSRASARRSSRACS